MFVFVSLRNINTLWIWIWSPKQQNSNTGYSLSRCAFVEADPWRSAYAISGIISSHALVSAGFWLGWYSLAWPEGSEFTKRLVFLGVRLARRREFVVSRGFAAEGNLPRSLRWPTLGFSLPGSRAGLDLMIILQSAAPSLKAGAWNLFPALAEW